MVFGLEGIVYLSTSSFLLLGLSSRAISVKCQERLPWILLTSVQRDSWELMGVIRYFIGKREREILDFGEARTWFFRSVTQRQKFATNWANFLVEKIKLAEFSIKFSFDAQN